MLRKLLFLLLLGQAIWAKVHYARIEPYESVVLKASVSGQVLEADLEAEGTMVRHARVIHIDDILDRRNLEDTRKSAQLLKEQLRLNEDIATSLAETLRRQISYYERISKLPTASKTQKDNAYNAYASAKTQYLGTKEKLLSLRKQLLDMDYKVQMLEDTIEKKSIVLEEKYLYHLMVHRGDFVAPGTPLARVDDANRAKLVLFLEPEELENIKERSVYIDGKKTDYKVNKVWKIADEKFISSYRAEIYIPVPKGYFSRLVKVEIK